METEWMLSLSSLKAQDTQVPLGIDAGETKNDRKCHFIIPFYDFLIYDWFQLFWSFLFVLVLTIYGENFQEWVKGTTCRDSRVAFVYTGDNLFNPVNWHRMLLVKAYKLLWSIRCKSSPAPIKICRINL